jgi:hypothetical protein
LVDAFLFSPQRIIHHAIPNPCGNNDERFDDSANLLTVCLDFYFLFVIFPTNERNRAKHITYILLLCLAGYSAVYGVSYAYLLHHVANVFSAWLVVIYLVSGGFSVQRIIRILKTDDYHHNIINIKSGGNSGSVSEKDTGKHHIKKKP